MWHPATSYINDFATFILHLAMDLSLECGHTVVLPSTRSSQQHHNQIWIRLNDNPLVTDIGSPCSRTYWQPHQLYIFSVGETLSSIIISNTTHCQLSLSLHSYLPGNKVFALIMRTTGSVLFHLTSQPLILHRGANCSCDRSIWASASFYGHPSTTVDSDNQYGSMVR